MPSSVRLLNRRELLASTGAALLATGLPAVADTPRPGMTRGINISRWLDGSESETSPPRRTILEKLREAGFKSVRLPLEPSPLASGGEPARSMQKRLTNALNLLEDTGFTVTVDMHPGHRFREYLQSDIASDAELDKAWRTTAEILADTDPRKVFPELLNEPPLDTDRWIPLRDRLAETVRSTLPQHPIIWGANRFQTSSETLRSPPLPDANAVAAVHFYGPMVFTHQCMSWSGDSPLRPLRDVGFPVNRDPDRLARLRSELKESRHLRSLEMLDREIGYPHTAAAIDQIMGELNAWGRSVGHPVIVNEFGVLRHCAPREDRLDWIEAVRAACDRNGLGWYHWELELGFGVMAPDDDSGTKLDGELIRRLIPDAVL